MEKGFIVIYRKMRDWEWYTDLNVFKLFIHLIISVNHCDKSWRGIEVKRGQLITSLEHLSIETGLTIQGVRTALNKLIGTKEILKESTNHFTLLTVVNYNDYQDLKSINNKPITNQQQTNNKPTTTTKQLKQLKQLKQERELSHFEFLKVNNPKEINKILNEYSLSKKELELCINTFNEKQLNPTINRFNKWIHNWKNNLQEKDQKVIENDRMANCLLNKAI